MEAQQIMRALDEVISQAEGLQALIVKEVNNNNALLKRTRKHSNWTNPNRYKTILCTHWEVAKECRFGQDCWYAHGREELRSQSSSGAGRQVFSTKRVSSQPRSSNDVELDLGGLLSDCSALAEPFISEYNAAFHMESNAARPNYGAIGEEAKRRRYNANGGSKMNLPGKRQT